MKPSKPSLDDLKDLAPRFNVTFENHIDALKASADLRDSFLCALVAGLIATRPTECHAMTSQPNSDRSGREGVVWLHDPDFNPKVSNRWTFEDGFVPKLDPAKTQAS